MSELKLRWWDLSRNERSLNSLSGRSFFEQREDEREDVVGYYLVSFCGGVGSVGLHHAVYTKDSLEKEWQQRDVVFLFEQRVGVVELVDVVGP